MNPSRAGLYRQIVITCMKTLLQVIALRHRLPESINLRMQTLWLASGVDMLDGRKPDAHIVLCQPQSLCISASTSLNLSLSGKSQPMNRQVLAWSDVNT